MDITKSQSEFEATFPIPRHVIRCGAGYAVTSYGAWEANSYLDLWKGWQASRESIVVELPKNMCGTGLIQDDDLPYYGGFDDGVKALASRLRTAGIRIKGESE